MLKDASKFAKDSNLSNSLLNASISVKELSSNLSKLIKILESQIKDSNSTKKEKSFGGMITTHQVSGAFWVAIKVSFFASLILALPFILWQFGVYSTRFYTRHEKSWVMPFVVAGLYV